MPIHLRIPAPNRIEYEYVGAISDAELADAQKSWVEQLQKADAEGRRLYMVVDGSRSEGMSAGQRRMASDFNKAHATLIGRRCAAQAVVLVSSIQRGVLTAIVWMSPPPAPLKAFSTRAEASAFLDDMERAESHRAV